VLVRAFDKDLRSEEPLGQAITIDGGSYHITYSPDLFRRADKNRADLIVRVFGQKGLLLATSDILFNAPAIATIDLTVSPPTIPLSEYEQHLVDLTPVLENVSLTELTDEDVAFLAGETGIDKQHINILRQAAQLTHAIGISTAVLYGLGRENISLSTTSLAATSLDTLRKTLETAISQRIVPASLHDSLADIMHRLKQLQLQQALKTREQFTAHDFTGQLLNQNTGAILAGFTIQAFDLDAETTPQDLGRDRTNAQGLFAFTYTTSKAWEANHTERKLRLSILDQQAQEMAQVDIQASLGQDAVMAVHASIPTAPVPVAPTTTLALLSTEPRVTQTLIQRGYTSLAAIARAPRPDFVSFAQDTLGDAGAAQLQEIARAQTHFLDNALTSLRLYNLNGLLFKQLDDASILGKLLTPLCDCQDCEAATSPGAYLADLLEYTLTHVKNGQDALTLQFLAQTFHQPFRDLPSSCDAVETQVRQVRLCVEVLRNSLNTTQATLSPGQQSTLEQTTKQYLIAAYTALLEQFGTSYEEIRLARHADGTKRAALAERLGIDLDTTRPDHLDALFLDSSAAATSPSALTEQVLERLFGLVDTTRNPLVTGTQPELLTWRLEHLRVLWKQEDWSTDPTSARNPFIDPDLIGPGDLRQPTVDDPAFQLWQERRNWIDGQMTSLKNEVLSATFPTLPASPAPVVPPLPHTPAIPSVTDSSSSPALTALDTIIASSLGISVMDLAALATQRAQGNTIEARLRQLNLSNEAFSYLWDIRTLLANNAPLLDSEWDDVYAILVQAKKLQVFAQWRQQEQERSIFLGPDFFTIPPLPTIFPPPEPLPLPSWRASADARRDWQQTLQSRIDQVQATRDALYAAVDAVEEAALPKLRDALIMLVQAEGKTLQAKAKWITDHLFIDALANGCLQTTRIAQAIESMQNLLTALRINRLHDTYPNLVLYADHFDEEWPWLGSYATWRTALLVFLYPENLLQPDLRTWQTPAFRDLTTNLRGNLRLNPQSACDAAANYADYFYDVCHLSIGACCQATTRMHTGDSCRTRTATDYRELFYLFAFANTSSQKVYWSAYDSSDASGYAQTFWEEVPELSGVLNIIGAVPYQLAPDQRAVYLFVRLQRGGQRLVFIKYDLEKQAWGQSTELELPNKATNFTAAVKQTKTEDQPPRLVIRTEDGAIYDRKLNADGTDWEDASADNKRQDQTSDTKQQGDKTSKDAWKPLIDVARGGDFAALFAMVEVAPDEYYLLVSTLDAVWYRLFGNHDDGHWRPFDRGTFSGAFSWPGTSDLFVFTTYAATTYRILKRSDVPLEQMPPDVISDSSALDLWLADVAGVMVYDILPTYNIENHDPGQDLDENSPQGKLWKEASALVQQFTADHLSLGEALYSVNHHQGVAFLSRGDSDVFAPPPDSVILSTFPEVVSGIRSGEPAPSGLDYIVPRSGTADTSVQIAFIRGSGEVGSYRCSFTRSDDALQEDTPIRLAPQVTGPFSLAEQLSSQKLQAVRFLVKQAFELNNDGPASNRTYLEEAYYFVPVLLALQLQSLGHYPAALDWFRHVYDYNTSTDARKIYYGLEQEQDAHVVYQRADNWLLDPLNPHTIATTRPGAYTRYTLLSLSLLPGIRRRRVQP